MIGYLVQGGANLDALFDGVGHAPDPLSPEEKQRIEDPGEPDAAAGLDLPGWLIPLWEESLGSDAQGIASVLRDRAPVHLRANLLRNDASALIDRLASHGVGAHRVPLSPTAVEIEGDGRALRSTGIIEEGLAELQDAASQAVADMVPGAGRILDYCAGGGGKALAVASRTGRTVAAHDADASRMSDLPNRARRAGVNVEVTDRPDGQFDAVLVDAPCSGSGAWRRQPEAKWRITPERLDELVSLQAAILDEAAGYVAEDGELIYATCSLLTPENRGQIDRFLERHEGWRVVEELILTPLNGGDGFYCARLTQREVET